MSTRFFVSPTRSAAARIKGAATRRAKKALIPGYGKKGIGWIRNPRLAAYNRAHRHPFVRILGLLTK